MAAGGLVLGALSVALAFLLTTAVTAFGKPKVLVRVEQLASGCFHHDAIVLEWIADGDRVRCGDRVLSRADIDAIRSAIVNARHEVPDLLAEVGITPELVEAHRETIVETVTASDIRSGGGEAPPLPSEVEPLLRWEALAPMIRDEVVGPSGSTERRFIRVTFTEPPSIVVESDQQTYWMLPWKVRQEGTSFVSEDLAIPRSLLALADLKGPAGRELDGSRYWSEGFWSDWDVWYFYLGTEVDHVLSTREYERLTGWERAAPDFVVAESMTGNVNSQPASLFLTVHARPPATVLYETRWHNLLVDGRPSSTWDDFRTVYDAAAAVVGKQRWLLEWKAASPGRTLNLEAVGTQGFAAAPTDLDFFVRPPWRYARLAGEPQYEILLREKGDCVGTVWMSDQEPRALILDAHTSGLEFRFHPRSNPPTYALADEDGRVHVRTMTRTAR